MMVQQEPSRTVHAQQAFELGDLFSYKFNALRFGKKRPRRLVLNSPDGPSTAGGIHARQSMALVDDETSESMVMGWIDVGKKKAELRSYEAVAAQYQQRFSQKIDLEAAEYQRCYEELTGFLKIQKIEPEKVEAAPIPTPVVTDNARMRQPDSSSAASDSAGILFAMLGLGIMIGLGVGYLAFGA